MPRCNNCGNTVNFSSSLIPAPVPEACGPATGLYANFDLEGSIDTMEATGADLDTAQLAYENPRRYFDTYGLCGSRDLVW